MNKSLLAIYVINSINLAADNLILPLLAIFVIDIGGNVGVAGAVFATGKLAHLFGSLLVLRVKDNKKLQMTAIAIGYFTKFVAWILLAFFPFLWLLFIGQAIIGFSGSFGLASFQSFIAEHLDSKKHISEYGALSVIEGVASAAGALAGGLLVAWQSFSVLLVVVATIELLTLILFIKAFKLKTYKIS